LPTFVSPHANVHKTYLSPENQDFDDIDEADSSQQIQNEGRKSANVRDINNKPVSQQAPLQPKPFLEGQRGNGEGTGISAAVSAAAGLLSKGPVTSSEKIGPAHQVAVDIKLPAIKGFTPHSQRVTVGKGYESMDEIV